MQYFVTGATGFIGKRLVKKLLALRGSTVHFLLREESRSKLPELLAFWGMSKNRAVPCLCLVIGAAKTWGCRLRISRD